MNGLFGVFFLIFLFIGCSRNNSGDDGVVTLPVLTTAAVTDVTSTGASGGGNVTSAGGGSVTARGICWGLSPNPTLSNSFTSAGTGVGSFSAAITGLTPSTNYYVRAYATNAAGTAYGNETVFTSSPPLATLPTLLTSAVTSIASMTVSCGGSVTAEGSSAVTERGVCWSLSPNPLITGEHTSDGNGLGTYISTVTGLTPLTTYYIRSYAKNSLGVSYGNELSFTTTSTDVYVAGFESNGAFSVAKIWKNGVASTLSAGGQGEANGLFVKNPNVYVAGWEGSVMNAKLWRNGTLSSITNSSSGANAVTVFVAGNDVYVAGFESNGFFNVPKVWKNGTGSSFLFGNFTSGVINAVFVKGTDIYAAGYLSNGTTGYAVVWKNGVPAILSEGTMGGASAQGVFVAGDDVFVAGRENVTSYSVPVLWKNGVRTVLSTGINEGEATGVFVSGTDVYVCGKEQNNGPLSTARVWKNGVPLSLTDGTADAIANAVYVLGDNVYVAGREYNNSTSKYVAKLWKNGIAISLTDGSNTASANAVFVQ